MRFNLTSNVCTIFVSQVSKKSKSSNPVVAQRKADKAKQVARNKQQRQMEREAMLHVDNPKLLREQLSELLDEESLSAAQRSRKKALEKAYATSLKKQIQLDAQKKSRDDADPTKSSVDISQIPLPAAPPPMPRYPPQQSNYPSHSHRNPPQHSRYPPQQYSMKKRDNSGLKPVISGESTVVALPKGQHDLSLKSLVPRELVRRPLSKPKVVASSDVDQSDDKNKLDEFFKSL